MSDAVRLDVRGNVAELVLDRPAKLNAIDPEMLVAIDALLEAVERGRPQLRVLIVRGEGRAFCTGADLGRVDDSLASAQRLADYLQQWHRVFCRLADSPVPSIAAVHGMALAGGFELMQTCDLAVVADDARLADQHARYGLFPGGGGTQRLARLAGERRAKWLMLSGEPLDPHDAVTAGLVNVACPAADVLPRARAMAELLARRSPVTHANVKEAVRRGLAGTTEEGLEIEREIAIRHMGSEDARIGLAAFAARSEPRFIGR